jgi:hypothetical protein
MIDAAPAIFVALEHSGFSAAVRQSPWIYPAANVGHILALAVFAGAIAVMDVGLLAGTLAGDFAARLARARALPAPPSWRWSLPALPCSLPRQAISPSTRCFR